MSAGGSPGPGARERPPRAGLPTPALAALGTVREVQGVWSASSRAGAGARQPRRGPGESGGTAGARARSDPPCAAASPPGRRVRGARAFPRRGCHMPSAALGRRVRSDARRPRPVGLLGRSADLPRSPEPKVSASEAVCRRRRLPGATRRPGCCDLRSRSARTRPGGDNTGARRSGHVHNFAPPRSGRRGSGRGRGHFRGCPRSREGCPGAGAEPRTVHDQAPGWAAAAAPRERGLRPRNSRCDHLFPAPAAPAARSLPRGSWRPRNRRSRPAAAAAG